MPWGEGPFLVASALLVISGVAKLRSPGPTQAALRAVGAPGPVAGIVLLALAEIAIGALAVLSGLRVAGGLVAACYLAYAAFVVLAWKRAGALASCGCFGQVGPPPTKAHLGLNLAFAAAAMSASVGGRPGLISDIARAPGHSAVLVGFAVMGTWLAYMVLEVLPRTRAAGEVA